ncbi:MAG: hypothetical protein JWM91_296 [Rhodospirillales bacterium]|nr:hypothetical protein [Rhodospirillales bacterium]
MSAWRGTRFAWLSALTASVLLMLAPAVWNGFPFMFYDTGAFIEMAVQGGFKPERSAFYSVFLSAFWPRFSLWPAMVAQVLMTVLVMAAFGRVVLPGLSPWRFFTLIVALSLCTGLPWYAAEVLPDILAPLSVLCLYLIGFHGAALGWPQKTALIAVAILGITSHASHLGLAAGLIAVIGLMQAVTRHVTLISASPRVVLPALVFALSLLSLVVSNFARTGDVFLSRSGPAFLFGRLVQDGIAKRVLDDTCPGSGYRLCAYKDSLPKDANDYLWGHESPFQSLGGFEGTAGEAESIIVESVKRYPWIHLRMAVSNTVEQLTTFETGDGIEPLNEIPVPAITQHLPGQLEGYRASRQQNSQITFRWINALQVPICALSFAALNAILVSSALRRDWTDRIFLPAFLLAALFGNAFICGALSNPQDRYQSRLMWAATFVVLLLTKRLQSRLWYGALAVMKNFRTRVIGPPDIGVAT